MALSETSFLQNGGPYNADTLRYLFESTALQAGVVGASHFKVTQRGAGANMSVDVAAGSAWVKGLSTTGQGFYQQGNDATVNVAIGAAHATNPRLDQVILRIKDSDVGDASDTPEIAVIAGTATGGATLDNRTGAVADGSITGSWIRLAEIRDRRPWARGGYKRIVRNANAAAGNDYTTTSTSAVAIDATNLAVRMECTGKPVRVSLRGRCLHSAPPAGVNFELRVDGAQVDGGQMHPVVVAAASAHGFDTEWDIVPTAGSRLFVPYYSVAAGTGTLYARATIPAQFVVQELVPAVNADNT
jgi:hypothetical protein